MADKTHFNSDSSRKSDKGLGLPMTITPSKLAAIGMIALLAGCSSVPDAVNPVEWYKGARDLITGDDEEQANGAGDQQAENRLAGERNTPPPGSDEPIPEVSSVPQRPDVPSRIERERIARGLVADRENARQYSDSIARRDGEVVNPLQPEGATRQAELAPAPPAQPIPPVMSGTSPEAMQAPTPPAPRPMMPAPQEPSMARAPTAAPTMPQVAAVPREPIVDLSNAPPPPRFASPSFQSVEDEIGTVVVSSSGTRPMETAASPARSRRALRASPAGAPRSLAEFDPTGVRGTYQVATILFDNGSANLDADDRRILRQVVNQQRQTGGTIRVVGHASSRTRNMDVVQHKMVNFQISVARADAVARELMKLGSPPDSLFVGAASDSEPVYEEFMPTGEAGNRRAEIFIDF